jgi:hypothetical protein
VLKLLSWLVEAEQLRKQNGLLRRCTLLVLRCERVLLWKHYLTLSSDDVLDDEEEPWFLQRSGVFSIATFTDFWRSSRDTDPWPGLLEKDMIILSAKVIIRFFRLTSFILYSSRAFSMRS